jgi:hypothetical protein
MSRRANDGGRDATEWSPLAYVMLPTPCQHPAGEPEALDVSRNYRRRPPCALFCVRDGLANPRGVFSRTYLAKRRSGRCSKGEMSRLLLDDSPRIRH